VSIHVKESNAEEELNAKLNNIVQSAIVPEDFKETQSSHAKKLVVHPMMTVLAPKNAISYQVPIQERNVNLCVLEEYVLREQAVKLLIIKKYVPAIIRYREMDMLPVMNPKNPLSLNVVWMEIVHPNMHVLINVVRTHVLSEILVVELKHVL
jgi:hypothetical protein